MPPPTRPESLRVLCLDGGGIKGYTSLLILKRIFRTMMAEGQLDEIPRPCNVFDLIVGTSTGGLIAVMLGRLHMTIDECIEKYEQLGKEVFGKKIHGGKLGRVLKGVRGSAFYEIEALQDQVRKILDSRSIPRDEEFQESGRPLCKVMLCVTRSKINKPDVLRSYESVHPTAENYHCTIWEAASATAAAPLFFKDVQFSKTGERWCDGGMRRNNPINEALSELNRERDWKDKKIGCILSIGTGIKKSVAISSNLASVLKGALAVITDSDDIARVFASSELGVELFRTHRYFRFSVPQGMQDLQLDEWKETEKMRALATDYLGHVGNGDLIARCAKSLLDPDENLHIGIKTKVSLIPYHTCTHFIERRIYSETLLKFFRSKTQLAQTFVLWGLGGVGKTQVALKFAQSMKHRLSVFWIRADRFSNFAIDYVQVLKEMDPANANQIQANTDLSNVLEKVRHKLEENPDEWLLILDNADDLDAFLGRDQSSDGDQSLSISTFLPRHGRLLITTRDRRFQGVVGAASDGMKVDSLTEEEAKELLIGSIPGYLIREGSDSMSQAKQLIEELGYLPLAIAQAAGNILEQQLTLSEYVSFYHDKKQRMSLMQVPAHDFRTTDPRNASQSVNITWQISFDLLKEKSPLSAVFMTYIGCFHWRNIPRVLLQRLPEFSKLPESEFIRLTKKPLNLSLIDEGEIEPGFTQYMVHPLVHENILGRLSHAETRPYLQHLVKMIWTVFPFVGERADEEWNIAVYLAPHAGRILELCDDTGLSSKELSILLLRTSQFSGISNLFHAAVDLAEKAKIMGLQEYSTDPEMITSFLSNSIRQYENASRREEAESAAQDALAWIDSDFVRSNMDQSDIDLHRIRFQSDLALNLMGSDEEKREGLHRAQLSTGLVNEWDAAGITIRHNLAHALLNRKKFDEARSLNSALLDFAETEDGKKEVSRRLYLIMLNLKCRIMRESAPRVVEHKGVVRQDPIRTEQQQEQVQIHTLVFKESLEQLGIEDVDTWKAINNLTSCLDQFYMKAECALVLREVLPVGIAVKIRAEGRLSVTLNAVTRTARDHLEHLEHSPNSNPETTAEFRQLLQQWVSSTGCSERGQHDSTIMSNHGVHLQQMGRFKEAELQHHRSIEMCKDENKEVPEIFYYNLMLAIGRQGRMADALAFREKHRTVLEGTEAAFGSLEQSLEKDRRDREIYDEAQVLMDKDPMLRDGEWWAANQRELRRAEHRYGTLKPRPLEPESEVTDGKGKKWFRISVRAKVDTHT